MEIKRKLASIRRIAEVKAIPEADKICAYRVDGWFVVDTVGKYQENELVVYLECDSWVPTELAPFLSKGKEPRIYKGVSGERLRTIKLKKQVSQGLLLPISVITENGPDVGLGFHCEVRVEECFDVTEALGIIQWEPEPEFRSADAKGVFPSFIPKSDQERIQNIYRNVEELLKSQQWEVTEKIDGQSHTSYIYDGEFGVCSRNLELKDSEDNTSWNTARKYKLEEKLRNYGKNVMIQGEQCGPGIQGNSYKLDECKLFVYDVFLIDEQRYLTVDERMAFCNELELDHVPIEVFGWQNFNDGTLEMFLKWADGKSEVTKGVAREGLVFKMLSKERVSFKIVSNSWLLNEK